MFGLNETRYGTKDLIAWDVNGGVEDITLHNLLVEVGLLEEDHEYEELTVVWEYADQEISIQEIYDNDLTLIIKYPNLSPRSRSCLVRYERFYLTNQP